MGDASLFLGKIMYNKGELSKIQAIPMMILEGDTTLFRASFAKFSSALTIEAAISEF